MASLNPRSHSYEVTLESMKQGFLYGSLTLIPSSASVYFAVQQIPSFARRTNWQARTALTLMPALFVFGATGEHHLTKTMRHMADETQHKTAAVEWADRVQEKRRELEAGGHVHTVLDTHEELAQLYRESVGKAGNFRIVPGDQLGLHHRVANFWQERPVTILFGAAIPTIGYIFYSRARNPHLQFQMQIMHTRVMGQFAVVIFMLALMGVKGYMDQHGKFITEADAENRVDELHRVRQELIEKLKHDREVRKEAERQSLEQSQAKTMISADLQNTSQ